MCRERLYLVDKNFLSVQSGLYGQHPTIKLNQRKFEKSPNPVIVLVEIEFLKSIDALVSNLFAFIVSKGTV